MQLSPRLELLVVKTGLHLGVLADGDRALVLALAACAIAQIQRSAAMIRPVLGSISTRPARGPSSSLFATACG
jgi:hypothetical protein